MTDESEQLPAEDLDLLGPIDYLVVGLPGRWMPGTRPTWFASLDLCTP
jgi:hypothetical protein